jgi:hypothetical protein
MPAEHSIWCLVAGLHLAAAAPDKHGRVHTHHMLAALARPLLACPPLPPSALQITGNFKYGSRDETASPNFYEVFAEKKGKPMIIPETSAWYNLCDKKLDACSGGVRGTAAPCCCCWACPAVQQLCRT